MSVSMPPYGGIVDVSAAAMTPGKACRRGSNASKNCCFAAAVLYCSRGSGRRATSTLLGSSPRSTVWSVTKLRMSSPAPASNTSESATSLMTSALRNLPRRKPPTTPRPESFSGSAMFFCAVCSAGTSPNTTAVNTATPRLNASTGMFRRMSASVGNNPCGIRPLTP